jgi:uncharacterized membrane protein
MIHPEEYRDVLERDRESMVKEKAKEADMSRKEKIAVLWTCFILLFWFLLTLGSLHVHTLSGETSTGGLVFLGLVDSFLSIIGVWAWVNFK